MAEIDQVKHLMTEFLKLARGPNRVLKDLNHSIQMSNQPMNRKDQFGRKKFETGRETILLYVKTLRGPGTLIARLHDGENGLEFEDLAISEHASLIFPSGT